jgi:hypothetical protein
VVRHHQQAPGHEFHFDDRDAADEIGATQLTGAPLVGTKPTQEQHAAMMADFNVTAERAGEALVVAASVEVEARATKVGASCLDRLLP